MCDWYKEALLTVSRPTLGSNRLQLHCSKNQQGQLLFLNLTLHINFSYCKMHAIGILALLMAAHAGISLAVPIAPGDQLNRRQSFEGVSQDD
jgi:hypothetical protein